MFHVSMTAIAEHKGLADMHRAFARTMHTIALRNTNSALYRAVAAATLDIMQRAAQRSPVITGTLKSAHRAEMVSLNDAVGRVFISEGITNPIFLGHPDEYGPEVHFIGAFGGAGRPKPWFQQTQDKDAPGIVEHWGHALGNHIESVFEYNREDWVGFVPQGPALRQPMKPGGFM